METEKWEKQFRADYEITDEGEVTFFSGKEVIAEIKKHLASEKQRVVEILLRAQILGIKLDEWEHGYNQGIIHALSALQGESGE